MPTINGKACVVNGKPVDKVFSNSKQVYGENLYIDTKDFNNSSVWNSSGGFVKTGDKYDGLTVIKMNGDWGGVGQTIQVNNGETYTFSAYARYESGTGRSDMYFVSSDVVNTNPEIVILSLNETWQRITGTVTITADGSIIPRINRTNHSTNNLLIAGLKLERGTTATPWTPAPEDVLK